jgi:hypothetical protein
MKKFREAFRRLIARWLDLELPEDRRDFWPGTFKGTWSRPLTPREIDELEKRNVRPYLIRPREWR